MAATRQDAWSEDDDLLLAEVTLRHIREGSTQLAAFEEVGYRLQRTAAACGFRWNSLVRKKYESAIQIAKAQRQQRKQRGKSRFMPEPNDFGTAYQPPGHNQGNKEEKVPEINRMKEYQLSQVRNFNEQKYPEYQTEFNTELHSSHSSMSHSSTNQASPSMNELDFDDVIRFLRQQKDSYRRMRMVDKELRDRDREIERLRDENQRMKKELDSIQNDYQTVNEDYKALIKIMDRARKLAFLADDDQEEKVSFKMDKNGNLERVERS